MVTYFKFLSSKPVEADGAPGAVLALQVCSRSPDLGKSSLQRPPESRQSSTSGHGLRGTPVGQNDGLVGSTVGTLGYGRLEAWATSLSMYQHSWGLVT